MRPHDLAKKILSIALLVLATAAAEGTVKAIAPRTELVPGAPQLADVDLDEVPVGRALRLLAETYDVSIATGALPDRRPGRRADVLCAPLPQPVPESAAAAAASAGSARLVVAARLLAHLTGR